jgi:hypothetical protein
MRVEVVQDTLRVRLALWQKILGLMRNVEVPLSDVSAVRVVDDAVREAMSGGMKVGLRLPWLYYAARSIRLDHAYVVRRGVPGLAVTLQGHKLLHEVVVSTPRAGELAEQISKRIAPAPGSASLA